MASRLRSALGPDTRGVHKKYFVASALPEMRTRISLRLETSVTFPLHVLHVLLWEPVACHGKNGPPKIGSPRNLFYCKIWTPTEKFGPPHIDEKNIDPEHIWTSGLSRRVSEVLETIQTRKLSTIVQASFPAEPHATFDTVYIAQLFL